MLRFGLHSAHETWTRAYRSPCHSLVACYVAILSMFCLQQSHRGQHNTVSFSSRWNSYIALIKSARGPNIVTQCCRKSVFGYTVRVRVCVLWQPSIHNCTNNVSHYSSCYAPFSGRSALVPFMRPAPTLQIGSLVTCSGTIISPSRTGMPHSNIVPGTFVLSYEDKRFKKH
jgi:hypothetical protein